MDIQWFIVGLNISKSPLRRPTETALSNVKYFTMPECNGYLADETAVKSKSEWTCTTDKKSLYLYAEVRSC